jgi:NO-binding membrane sensor protein with MHYT domain
VAQLNDFTYGPVTPILAYALSFLGSLLGLIATTRARAVTEPGRKARWLLLAAWSIGGTGIWVMHFMAMIGFSAGGAAVRYDLPVTLASWLTAIIVVGIGLFIVGFGRPTAFKIIAAGLFTGLGVAGMHYTGMSAMSVNGDMSYDYTRVGLSIAIAVVAATAALWFTLVVRRTAHLIAAALIMGVAVTGMHYAGMTAMHLHLSATPTELSGVDPLALLVPIMVFVLLVVIALAYAMLAVPSSEDTEIQRELAARLADKPAEVGAPPPTSAFATRPRAGR